MAIRSSHVVLLLAGALAASSLPALAAQTVAPKTATGAAGSSADIVVAQAGSVRLDGSDIRALVASLPLQTRAVVRSNLNSLEQVVQGDLMRQAVLMDAKASGFDHDPATLTQLDHVRDEALVNLWIASRTAAPAEFPSEAEIQAAYDANRQALASPAQYRIAQIFISAPNGGDTAKLAAALRKASELAGKIAGGDFAQLAAQQSEDSQSANHGGDLGYLPADRIVPEILAAVQNLQPGQVVGPIKTAQGLHFLKLEDKKPGVIPTLVQAHDGLAIVLRQRREAQLRQAYLATYSAKLGVAVNQIELAKLQSGLPR
jgi:peptidylprolyl isomerase